MPGEAVATERHGRIEPVVVFVIAALVIVLMVILVSGVAALPLALGAISVLALIVLAFRGLVDWFSGDRTRI